MPPTPFLRPSIVLRVLPIVAALALRAATAGAEDGSGSDPADRLVALQAAIESAFGRCDARPLKDAFPRRLKTYMAAGSLGVDGGYYGADQALLILRRVFAARATVRFSLEAARSAPADDSQVTTRARWTFRHEGTPAAEVRLSFTLKPEGGAWFLRELRELK